MRLASVEPRAATTTRGCSSAWTKKGRWVSSLSGLPRRSRLRSAGRPPSLSTSTASVKRLRDRSTSRRQHRCVAIQSGNARSRLSERLSHSSEPKLRSMMGSASIRDAVRSRQRILERAASDVPVSSASADGSSSRREWLEAAASGLPRNAWSLWDLRSACIWAHAGRPRRSALARHSRSSADVTEKFKGVIYGKVAALQRTSRFL